MNMAHGRVIVVGSGVIGVACAYYLSRAGWTVTIVERGAFARGCSHGNCGFVSPSHPLPLAEPGAVRKTLQALFRANAPFYIKPRFDPALWSWLFGFARRCNARAMLEAGHACQALLNSAMSLYRQLIDEERLDCEWQNRGVLLVYQSRLEMEHYAETEQLLRESFHLPATRYDGPALVEREPALKPGLAGGWHYAMDAHLRPDKLMSSWRHVLEKRGVALEEQCEVLGFASENGQARALVTSRGDLPAEAFVIAAGAWTPLLQKQLGCKIPIQPGKGYSLTMPRPRICPAIPLLFMQHKVAVTPMDSGYRLGSTLEFSGYDATLKRRRIELLRAGASHYLLEPHCEPVEEEWFGWRPMTYDGKPIIDRSPIAKNVIIAAGHNMLGLSMAPATGKLVAELLGGLTPHIETAPYLASRF